MFLSLRARRMLSNTQSHRVVSETLHALTDEVSMMKWFQHVELTLHFIRFLSTNRPLFLL